MTEDKFLKLLRRHIFNNYGTQRAAAKHWGLSDAAVSYMVLGHRRPAKVILDDMKFKIETVTTYKRV